MRGAVLPRGAIARRMASLPFPHRPIGEATAAAKGHEERSPRPRLNGRCQLRKQPLLEVTRVLAFGSGSQSVSRVAFTQVTSRYLFARLVGSPTPETSTVLGELCRRGGGRQIVIEHELLELVKELPISLGVALEPGRGPRRLGSGLSASGHNSSI
jgi:hypothetical protein